MNIELNNGQMLDFDGVGDYVNCGVIPKSDIGTLLVSQSGGTINYLYSNWGVNRHYMYIGHGRLYTLGLGSSGGIPTGIVASDDDRLCLTHNNGTWVLHINGIEVTNGVYSGTVVNEGVDTFIGSRDSAQYPFEGKLGNVQVFAGTAFTPEQVAYDYANPHKALYKDASGNTASDNPDIDVADCVAWLPLTEGQGAYVRDMVSYGEGDNILINSQFDSDLSSWSGSLSRGTTSWDNGRCKIVNDGADSYPYISQGKTVLSNTYYMITFTVDIGTATLARVHIYDDINGSFYNIEVTESGTYQFMYVSSTETSIYVVASIWETGSTGSYLWYDDIYVQQLSGTTQLPHTNPDTVAWVNGQGSNKGLQMPLIERDSIGKMLGLSGGIDMHGQKPALPIDMTDSELWGNGRGFSVEFVIERELIAEDKFILNTGVGIQFRVNVSWNDGLVWNRLSDGTIVQSTIDENPHHIVLSVSPTEITMYVDGVAGTPVAHNFVPSGLNFKDATQSAPDGTLYMFKLHNRALLPQEVARRWEDAQAEYSI